MKPDYDNLTPAQKAKFTRLANKLDEQRYSAYQIQWETYKEKSAQLHAETEPQIAQIKDEAENRIAELSLQIKEIREKANEEISKLRNEVRAECAPEFQAYEDAFSLASKWRNQKWETIKNEFWKELGYDVEQKSEEQKSA